MDKQKIEILISAKAWDPKPWAQMLSELPAVEKVHIWPTEEDLSKVEALFVWKPLDAGVVDRLPNLKWISSLGAGVDHLMTDSQIPEGIPVTRVVDPFLTRDMTNYVVMAVIMYQRRMDDHKINQNQRIWDRLPYMPLKIGVMGLGVLGSHLAKTLVSLGFETAGYSRSPKNIEGVDSYHGSQLNSFLSNQDVLVNLLPVTPETESMLNEDLFNQMKEGAYLINVARGNHLVERDLINALDSNTLSGALLDVFREEPLPETSPLWSHPKIKVTPHVASVSTPESVISLLNDNIQRLVKGEDLLHRVSFADGY